MSDVISKTLIAPTSVMNINLLFVRYIELTKWNLKSLKDSFWRFYLPFQDGGVITYNSKITKMTLGNMYLIPPYTDCSSRAESSFTKLYCHFGLNISSLRFKPDIYEFKCDRNLDKQLLMNLKNNQDNNLFEAYFLDSYILERICHCLQSFPRKCITYETTYSECIQNVINRINQTLCNPLSNDELAAPTGLHRNSFIRLFTSEVGVSPGKYSLNKRLEIAAHLLTNTDEKIELIANKCGFWDRNYFSNVFKKYWNQPPATYRKVNK